MIKLKNISYEIRLRILSEILIKISSFFIIPIITYNLGIDDYGIYIIAISIVSGIMPIFLLGLNFTVVKKLAVEKKIKNNVIKLTTSVFLVTILFTVTLALMFPFIYILYKQFIYLSFLALTYAYFSSLQILILEFLRSKLQSNSFSVFQIIDSVILITFVMISMTLLNFNLFLLFKILILNKILISISILIYLKRLNFINFSDIQLDSNLFIMYLKPGFIYVILGLTEWLVNFSDKVIIGMTSSALILSIYFTVGILASSINSLGSIYWWDLYPKLSKLDHENKSKEFFNLIQSKTQSFTTNVFFLIISLIIFSPTIQSLILNKNIEIEPYVYILFFISIFIHQISTGWEFFCYIKNQGTKVFITSIIWGSVSLVLYSFLIPLFNINGALISFLISKLGYSLTLRYFAKSLGFQRRVFIEKNFNIFMPFITVIIILLILDHFSTFRLGLNISSLAFLLASFVMIYWPAKFIPK